MGLSISYTLSCNLCGTDTGTSQLTAEDAYAYAARGGWYVNRGYGAAVCDECHDEENDIVHVHPRGHMCVLCLSGEHLEVII